MAVSLIKLAFEGLCSNEFEGNLCASAVSRTRLVCAQDLCSRSGDLGEDA
jgi:hypothetical protein